MRIYSYVPGTKCSKLEAGLKPGFNNRPSHELTQHCSCWMIMLKKAQSQGT